MNTQRKLIAAMSLCAAVSIPTIASAISVSGQGTWESTLQGRDLDGDLNTFEAYYDTSLNITWLADANYAGTSMTWFEANTWAANLNPYASNITGWRLPTVSPIDGTTADDAVISNIGTEDSGHNVSAPGTLFAGSKASEMAYLFYNTFSDKSQCNPSASSVSGCVSQSGSGLSNSGPFLNVQSAYWSATEFAPNSSDAWIFFFYNGFQGDGSKYIGEYAWAVHDGDVGAVPIPAAAWLFGSGLLRLIGVARKKTA